jgi:hypothetical protein
MPASCCQDCAEGKSCSAEKKTETEKPKRPLNKWMQYLQEFRAKHKEEFVGKSSKVIVAAAAAEYKSLPK